MTPRDAIVPVMLGAWKRRNAAYRRAVPDACQHPFDQARYKEEQWALLCMIEVWLDLRKVKGYR